MDLFWDVLIPFLGLLLLWKIILKGFRLFHSAYLTKELPLIQRYGKASWALVTGCTDGIGLQFCHSLAKRGFNLVMISRNEEKIREKMREIVKLYPDTQFLCIPADFSQGTNPEFYEAIFSKVKHLDISIIVNNVGILFKTLLKDTPAQEVLNTCVVNLLPQALFHNLFLPTLQSRSSRSAYIDISSSLTIGPMNIPLYSSTKIFNQYLTLGLDGSRLYQNIDFLCVRPNSVSTNINGHPSINAAVATTEDCVESSLRCLGNCGITYGSNKHIRYGWIIECLYWLLPISLANWARLKYRLLLDRHTTPPTPLPDKQK